MQFVRAPLNGNRESVCVSGVNVELHGGFGRVNADVAAILKESFGFTDCTELEATEGAREVEHAERTAKAETTPAPVEAEPAKPENEQPTADPQAPQD